jgi:hypothetical protein
MIGVVMAARLALAAVVLMLLAAAPLAGASSEAELTQARPVHGGLHLKSSKRGAILTGRRMRPGSRRSGIVTIANTGRLNGRLTLRRRLHGSKRLARQLRLIVRERRRAKTRVVYSGTLAGLHKLRLGVIGAGRSRTFSFTVSLRASAPNSLQGLRTSADFVWTAVQPT